MIGSAGDFRIDFYSVDLSPCFLPVEKLYYSPNIIFQ